MYATHVVEQASVTVTTSNGTILFEAEQQLSPTETLSAQFSTAGAEPTDGTVTIRDLRTGATLVSYTPQRETIDAIPEPAKAAAQPQDIVTNEELFLTAQHLEQYRHATYLPDPYYQEGLKRDPKDARINNAYGLLLLRRGQFEKAKRHFDTAIERFTERNPNPYDSEAYFNLGLVYTYLGAYDKAFDAFYKATWDNAQQEASYFSMAALSAREQKWSQALEFVERGLEKNTKNMRARGLRAYILRRMGRMEEAQECVNRNLQLDAFDFVSGYEHYLACGDESSFELMRGYIHNYLKLAREYASFSAYQEARDVLARADQNYPLAGYYQAYYLLESGRRDEAGQYIAAAERADSYCCFPNKLEDILALRAVIKEGRRAGINVAKAAYYLGCLYYDKLQSEDAIALWEESEREDPSFATVHRNLSLAYYNKRGDARHALDEMETAFSLDQSDARVFLELDQLHRTLGASFEERLKRFEQNRAIIEQRDDLFIEYLTVLNMTGWHAQAYELMGARQFHAWEGGEGKVTTQYRIALTLLAHDAMRDGDWQKARILLTKALSYPHNLGEGKLEGRKDNDLHYYLGIVEQHLGNAAQAEREMRLATVGPDEVKGAMYYNDQPAQMILFQGLAHAQLGERGAANARFYRLLDFGEQHLGDDVSIEYFAVSLPDFLIYEKDYSKMNHVHCLFVMALAYIGLGK